MNLTLSELLVDEVLAQQRAKGRVKYGKGLDFQDNDNWSVDALEELADAVQYLAAEVKRLRQLSLGECRHPEDWHDDHGPVLWWRLPVSEPPWVGSPLDSDWPGDGFFHGWQALPTQLPSCPCGMAKCTSPHDVEFHQCGGPRAEVRGE